MIATEENSALGLGGGVAGSPGFGAEGVCAVPVLVGAVTGVALACGFGVAPVGCWACATTGGAVADGEEVGAVGCEVGDVGDAGGVDDCEGRVEGECAVSIGRTSGPPLAGVEP